MDVVERMRKFAAREIAGRESLHTSAEFPRELWRDMGKAGLLGLYAPAKYGGLGADLPTVIRAGEALAGAGGGLGLTLSWLLHNIVSGYLIGEFADEAQQARYLPSMAAGSMTVSVAVSEPGVGAHPKHLKTRASAAGEDFQIEGQKTWITNGTLAEWFIVVAITAEEGGMKRYSGFFVARGTPGLTIEPITSQDFLRPSPHATLNFQNCRVPGANRIGPPGEAYPRMVKPLRIVEDVLALGALSGGMGAVSRELAKSLRAAETLDSGAGDLLAALGRLTVLQDATRELALRAAAEVGADTGSPTAERLTLAAHELARQFQTQVEWVKKEWKFPGGDIAKRLARDMEALLGLPYRIEQGKLRRLGQALLNQGK